MTPARKPAARSAAKSAAKSATKTAAKTAAKSAPRRTPLDRLRAHALALPEAHEVEAWGEPTFRVRNKLFAMYASVGTHHTAGRAAAWCKVAPANQDLLIRTEPDRYFMPPYVGKGGWVGVYLDGKPDWPVIAELLAEGWRMTAPKRLVAEHDAPPDPPPAARRR